MEAFFLQHSASWGLWIYVFIFFGMLLEGETVMFLAVYLAQQGYLPLGLVLGLIIVGVILGDVIWYEAGKHLQKLHWIEKWFGKIATPLDRRLQKKPRLTLFLAKFTYGLHRSALLRAGALRMQFSLFFWIEVLASLLWICIISGIAYFSAVSLHVFEHYFQFVEIGVLLAILFFLLVMYLISKGTEHVLDEEV